MLQPAKPVHDAPSMFGLENEIRKTVRLANAVCIVGLHGVETEGLEEQDAASLLEIGYDLLAAARAIEKRFDDMYSADDHPAVAS